MWEKKCFNLFHQFTEKRKKDLRNSNVNKMQGA